MERVVDGDTLWVRVDRPGGSFAGGASHKIRLLEIDTPETQHPDLGVECWGPESSAFAKDMLPVGSVVYLQADVEDTDRYGRSLRYLWTEDGTFYNLAAVGQGHAEAVLYEPNDAYIDVLEAAERQAREAKRGLWSAACGRGGPTAAETGEGTAETGQGTVPPAGPAAPGCAPGYDPCVPRYPPDVDCADVDGPISVTGDDPHGLDGDDDGIACES